MKIAIVDDNKEFLLIIKNVLININNQLNISCFEDGFTFLKKAMEYELVFLDIDMPNIDGITLSKLLYEHNINIIFVTAHEEKMIHAFGKNVIGFVLKDNLNNGLAKLLNDLSIQTNKPYLIIPNKQTEIKIYFEEIVYISYYLHDVNFHLVNQSDILVKDRNLKDFETLLNDDFMLINRSTIINLAYANNYKNGNVYLMDKKLPVSRRQAKDLQIKIIERKLAHVKKY